MAKNDKKKSIYAKPEKVKKSTLMLLKSKHNVVEGKIDGKVVVGCKKFYGKDYYIVLNDQEDLHVFL